MPKLEGSNPRALALALALACFPPVGPALAGGGGGDDDDSRETVVPAAACVEVAVNGAAPPTASAFQPGGAFAVQGGLAPQTATLRCALGEADRSGRGPGDRLSAFRVYHLDSDGVPAANADVAVTLVRTDLSPIDLTGFGFRETPVCAWRSSANGSNYTQGGTATTVPCAADLSRDGFHHFRVELTALASSAAGVTNRASFLGIELVDD